MQTERYLLELYRYSELNPVRAGMVDDPSGYNWSSYAINALSMESELQTPHPVYLALGKSENEQFRNYRKLLNAKIGTDLLLEIRAPF